MQKRPVTPPAPSSTGQPQAQPFEAVWRERFGKFAIGSEDDAGIAGWSPSGLDARMRRFAGLYGPRNAGKRWLDAGCGAGTYTRLLVERGADVIGVDYSLPTILKARSRCVGAVRFAVADVRYLPFRAGAFDGVLCLGVMQALSDAAPGLKALAALPAPGGELWVDALNRWCVVHVWEALRRKLTGRPMHLRYESPWTIKRLMSENGMVNVELHWMPILPRRWQRFQAAFESPMARWCFEHVPLLGLSLCHAFIVRGEKPARSVS